MEARNGIYSIRAPAHWDEITAYTRGEGKPSPEIAQQAFAELLENVKMENCRFSEDVVNSLLRRAPVRLEAEDYGQGGLNRSYFVKNTDFRAKQYRTSEPVPVESTGETGGGGRNRGGQAIQLTAGEWTAYTIGSQTAEPFKLALRAHNEGGGAPTALEISVNDNPLEVNLSGAEWTTVSAGVAPLRQGENHIKISVKSGAAGIDWLEFQRPESGGNQ
jgi:hypothetical protein